MHSVDTWAMTAQTLNRLRRNDGALVHGSAISRQRTKDSLVMRNSVLCICENKDADQFRGNREADQRLCFRYIGSTISLLFKYKISSL